MSFEAMKCSVVLRDVQTRCDISAVVISSALLRSWNSDYSALIKHESIVFHLAHLHDRGAPAARFIIFAQSNAPATV